MSWLNLAVVKVHTSDLVIPEKKWCGRGTARGVGEVYGCEGQESAARKGVSQAWLLDRTPTGTRSTPTRGPPRSGAPRTGRPTTPRPRPGDPTAVAVVSDLLAKGLATESQGAVVIPNAKGNVPATPEELALLVRRRWPHISVIITSGHLEPDNSMLPQETVFIAKPYGEQAPAMAIRALLD